ncbi:MAG TPA: heme-binding domain-containing protein, partial [Verrucomicrobiae bacterium]|nr:heme-binding domain-containing protein [Verrucomicrobiae bacterium]
RVLATLDRSTPPPNLTSWLQPGHARWLPESRTVGQRGFDNDILTVDTLTVPYDNPWSALMFLSGVDFTPDGAAYVSTIHGDVWRVTGIDDRLRELRWKRYATGLFQPLGLKVRDGRVFVLGRDQITRLHDLNEDGEADFYENFCNLIQTSTGGHDYVTCLEQDDRGNFYYVDPKGLHRVPPHGLSLETIATGWRNPNGMGVSPDGRILTVAPQQGEWTPSSQISEARPGNYFGYGGPRVGSGRPQGYDAPLCWIPHSVDNSSGSQVWVPRDLWGPLGGQMLHLLWGRCGLMLLLRDEFAGGSQGAVVPLPGKLLSGPNRGTFRPQDGHLYVAGSTGWQTAAAKDGALQRIRYTGRKVYLPTAWHAHSNGLALTFAQPL